MGSKRVRLNKQHVFSVDLGPKLAIELGAMRAALDSDKQRLRPVTRGDVIRLALWRLKLALICHEGETTGDPETCFYAWNEIATLIKLDGACPEWLVPGRAEQPVRPTATKKGRTKK